MKNSRQRKTCFLVVCLQLLIFVKLSGQPPENPQQARVSGTHFSGREMLKNNSPDFLAIPEFYPLFSLSTFPEVKNSLKRPGAATAGLPSGSIEKRLFQPDRPAGTGFAGRTDEPVIPSNFYYLQSGFFCKREWELEKSTHIPFRFRLGSLDYCNALEGKR